MGPDAMIFVFCMLIFKPTFHFPLSAWRSVNAKGCLLLIPRLTGSQSVVYERGPEAGTSHRSVLPSNPLRAPPHQGVNPAGWWRTKNLSVLCFRVSLTGHRAGWRPGSQTEDTNCSILCWKEHFTLMCQDLSVLPLMAYVLGVLRNRWCKCASIFRDLGLNSTFPWVPFSKSPVFDRNACKG